jgi:hypothetical protein
MKQTAVEWLVENSHIIPKTGLNKRELINQAKAMEKEQIENAFNYGQFDLGMEADEYYINCFKTK